MLQGRTKDRQNLIWGPGLEWGKAFWVMDLKNQSPEESPLKGISQMSPAMIPVGVTVTADTQGVTPVTGIAVMMTGEGETEMRETVIAVAMIVTVRGIRIVTGTGIVTEGVLGQDHATEGAVETGIDIAETDQQEITFLNQKVIHLGQRLLGNLMNDRHDSCKSKICH